MSSDARLKQHKSFLLYCTLAGFISAWAISGMLTIIDYASGTPAGTFFAVIGFSLGFYDFPTAQAIGFGLHLLTGLVAGNIFGQVAMFWRRLSPVKATNGVMAGMVVGIALWAVLFLPLAVFGIQSRLDTFSVSAPNQSVSLIASHFQGLQYLIIGGSFVFHLVYGALMGLIAGMLYEVRQKRNVQMIEK